MRSEQLHFLSISSRFGLIKAVVGFCVHAIGYVVFVKAYEKILASLKHGANREERPGSLSSDDGCSSYRTASPRGGSLGVTCSHRVARSVARRDCGVMGLPGNCQLPELCRSSGADTAHRTQTGVTFVASLRSHREALSTWHLWSGSRWWIQVPHNSNFHLKA